MSKKDTLRKRWRALLTETLPYEVPLIFSNDRLFIALVNDRWIDEEQKLFNQIVLEGGGFTRPYSYKINKDRGGKTTLSLAHPRMQLRMSEFYNNYAQTILQYTRKSSFSTRHPISIAPIYSEAELAGGATFKAGLPHVNPEDGEVDVSHIVSFFTYKYNILSKFVGSDDYISLEKKFSTMRTLDVAKCFFNIYTHSITWAVKNKDFAKANKDFHSFESAFDELMQKSNYNETNGIIVGPEISRIFAEIIFQEIDNRVRRRLASSQNAPSYDIRRYVDDFFIFANSDDDLDVIEEAISEELEKFKLFINSDKKTTVSRPFVSAISLARREIGASMADLRKHITDVRAQSLPEEMRRSAREVMRRIGDLRLVVAQYGVGFHTISGWIFTSLRSTLEHLSTLSKAQDVGREQLEALTGISSAILRLVFYIFSLDVRVRTTYSICQIMIAIGDFSDAYGGESKEYLQQIAFEELLGVLEAFCGRHRLEDLNHSVEVQNISIIMSSYLSSYFRETEMFDRIVRATIDSELSYFGYISAKFCVLHCSGADDTRIAELDAVVETRLLREGQAVRSDSETYMMMTDFLAASNISRVRKRRIIEECLNFKKATKHAMDTVLPKLSFVDWNGTQIKHLLERKQLRSIYTWS